MSRLVSDDCLKNDLKWSDSELLKKSRSASGCDDNNEDDVKGGCSDDEDDEDDDEGDWYSQTSNPRSIDNCLKHAVLPDPDGPVRTRILDLLMVRFQDSSKMQCMEWILN